MRIDQIITTIDSHTAGEPTRVVTNGLPHIPGNTMVEKMRYFSSNLDYIRTALIHEPRGHKNMIGAVLLPPTNEEANVGVFYLNSGGYLNMCGHGSIGVATSLIEMGWIPRSEFVTKVVLDTPAGLVTVNVHMKNGHAIRAGLINVPSFLYAEGINISLQQIENIRVDVAFGGNFYILVNAKDLGLTISSQNIPEFIRRALLIADEVNKEIKIVHPDEENYVNVRATYFYGPPTNPMADSKTLIIGNLGNVDRSPCGTGTSARIGALYNLKKLKLGQTYCTESVIGTLFEGKALEERKVGEYFAVVPEITGNAYITGIHQFLIESSDPLKHGFVLE